MRIWVSPDDVRSHQINTSMSRYFSQKNSLPIVLSYNLYELSQKPRMLYNFFCDGKEIVKDNNLRIKEKRCSRMLNSAYQNRIKEPSRETVHQSKVIRKKRNVRKLSTKFRDKIQKLKQYICHSQVSLSSKQSTKLSNSQL
jgi:hypothetical protein